MGRPAEEAWAGGLRGMGKGSLTEGVHRSGGAKPESSPAGEVAGLADHRLPRGPGYGDKITLFLLGRGRLVSRGMWPRENRLGCAGGLGQ